MNRCKFFVKNPEDLDAELNICEKIDAPWLQNLITGEIGYDKVTVDTSVDPEEVKKATKKAKKAEK